MFWFDPLVVSVSNVAIFLLSDASAGTQNVNLLHVPAVLGGFRLWNPVPEPFRYILLSSVYGQSGNNVGD